MKKTLKVTQGEISSPFGMRPDPLMPATWVHHNGIDIAAPKGTSVLSPIDGTVMGCYKHSTGGNTLILADDCGTIRVGMCHLNGFFVRQGDIVRKGERIATVGDTGRCTGPHLHLSLKRGGTWNFQYREYIGGKWHDPTEILEFQA